MCLTLTEKSGIRIAREGIICYKVMKEWHETLISPYQNMPYECGTTYVMETPIKAKRIFPIGLCLEEGFHSISNEKEAERLKLVLQSYIPSFDFYAYKYVVVKCLIPTGTRYAVGSFSDFGENFDSLCSEQIIVLEEV